MKILVAGGAGFIGAHTCVALAEAGYEPVVVDSLVNGHSQQVSAIETLIGREIEFIEADIRDRQALDQVFTNHRITAVINFAGYKSVAESGARPLEYYDNNLTGMVSLLSGMHRHGVRTLLFSSSAAVYGDATSPPIAETAPPAPLSVYARSKYFIEEMLRDLVHADASLKVAILRYFNPVGAHPSGLIGELPGARADNLMPRLVGLAAGEQDRLEVFGGDYDTPDGSAIRDYIHVVDLAAGHCLALRTLLDHACGEVLTLNLGTGRGYSVLEMLREFESACGRKLPYEIVARRDGDIACSYADPALALKQIGWRAERDIADMCRDAWNRQLRLAGSKAL